MANILDLDYVIGRLLDLRNQPPGGCANLAEWEIDSLVKTAREVLLQQPMLLEIDTPVKVCGNLHGQYSDLLRMLGAEGLPPAVRYLFLGGYVDRGRHSIEVMSLLLAFKVKHPEDVFLLRGNHECTAMNRRFGFYKECQLRYSKRLWRTFNDLFNCMPVAAIVRGKIFCCHGGLSPSLRSLDQIRELVRPTDVSPDIGLKQAMCAGQEAMGIVRFLAVSASKAAQFHYLGWEPQVPRQGLITDLLWSDPSTSGRHWVKNVRGISFTFGEREVREFLSRYNLAMVVRAHQMVHPGYEFFAGRGLLTVFSAPNYAGRFNNSSAVLNIYEDLTLDIHVYRPE